MVLRHMYRPLKQDLESRKPTYIWSTDLSQGFKNALCRIYYVINKLYLKNWVSTCKRIKLGLYVSPHTKSMPSAVTLILYSHKSKTCYYKTPRRK